MSKSKDTWEKLFSPPCPNCGSNRISKELRATPIMGSMREILRIQRLLQENKSVKLKMIKVWTCLDCGSHWDEKGGAIIFKRRKRR